VKNFGKLSFYNFKFHMPLAVGTASVGNAARWYPKFSLKIQVDESNGTMGPTVAPVGKYATPTFAELGGMGSTVVA
jgi:hypothetical protein